MLDYSRTSIVIVQIIILFLENSSPELFVNMKSHINFKLDTWMQNQLNVEENGMTSYDVIRYKIKNISNLIFFIFENQYKNNCERPAHDFYGN